MKPYRNRILLTFILASALAVAGGFVRPNVEGVPEDQFWAQKLLMGANRDIVVAGDSRVLMGVSPAEMSKTLEDCRIGNFAFDACCYNDEYLTAVGKLLDGRSACKAIVLGISPLSLTGRYDVRENRFLSSKEMRGYELYFNSHFGGFIAFFSAYSLPEAKQTLKGRKATEGYRRVFCPDGFAVAKAHMTYAKQLDAYRRFFSEKRVSQSAIDEVTSAVRKWSAKGIKVYGFRPPAAPEMVELEHRMSGFREAEFVKEFQAAGGIWLDLSGREYNSCDASHLSYDAALQFSHDLAQAIRDDRSIASGDRGR